jgi:hypothetical protein
MKKPDRRQYRHDPEIDVVLDELVSGTSAILGDSFIGAWLQGSSATGHFDAHSDLDFAIGIENDLSPGRLRELQGLHPRLHSHRSPWAVHLEGSYFPMEILRDYKLSGTPIWYLDHGSTRLERSSHDNTVAVKWILREKGVVLAGPDPHALIDPIPTSALRQDIYDQFAAWGRVILEDPEEINNRFYQSFAVLSYCRMLHDLQHGAIGSKREGAEWAKTHWGAEWHDLIDRAWGGRPNPALAVTEPADPDDLRRTVDLVEAALDEARQLMASLGLDTGSEHRTG